MKEKDTIALFIDADNALSRRIETVLSELVFYIAINIQKSYGIPPFANWLNIGQLSFRTQVRVDPCCMAVVFPVKRGPLGLFV
ncbi:hypothetical protein D3C85_259490 [compost metagenome]